MTDGEEPFAAFRRLDLRIGTVVSVEDHPDAEKLYILKVDLGEEEPRTVVTNIKSFYPPEKMMGRKLLLVANLKPANFRGVKSFGMLCAADDMEMGGNSLLLLDPSVDVPNGTVMNCGLENSQSRVEMKHIEKVTMKVAKLSGGKFMGMDIEVPDDAPEPIVAVIDGDKAIALGDGNGCFMTVDGDIKDGAPAI
ncbi:EMAP domain protein [Thermoplasmatales archaeon BRNA1]|nr:EMAP domain protein [Thermoplasmatales archaeon BRNA1]